MTGVPAEATHVCTAKWCGIYYRIRRGLCTTVPPTRERCSHPINLLKPIAEAGPAPTTAAPAEQPVNRCDGCRLGTTLSDSGRYHLYPNGKIHMACTRDRYAPPAEQLSGKVTRQSHPYQPAMTLSEIGRDEELPESWTKRPAEQPGKAADPRPAQPQAPAEPTPTTEEIKGAVEWMSEFGCYDPDEDSETAFELARVIASFAAPLREERDRLRKGLEESLKLQTHYAELLNMHDGGERIGFPTVQSWLDRLDEVSRGR